MLECLTSMNKKYRDADKEEAVRALHGVAKGMTDKDSVLEFVKVMLTESEQHVIGRRILLAQMLLTGHNHTEIKERLHISPNNFIRTRRWVEKQIPNYREVAKEVDKTQERKSGGFAYINPLTFTGMKRKSSKHFLLSNISDDLLKK